jgi:hypothetical protein
MDQRIEFTDLNDVKRIAEYLVVIDHDGEDFVEAKIVGDNTSWEEWYDLEEFQNKNPYLVLSRKPIGE